MDYQFLQAVVQLNFLPVCICIFLVYFLYINHPYEKRLTKRFYPIVALVFCLIIVDNLDYYCIDACITGISHRAIAMLGYDIRLFILASLIDVVIERINVEKSNLIYIPAFLNVAIILPCLWSNIVFSYEPNTCNIIRGQLAFIPHIISAIYVFILLVLGIRNILLNKAQEGILLFICSVLCVLGVLAEMIYQLRGIIIGVIAFNMVFYYMYLHIEHFKYDTLTGALNKESFYADITKFSKHYITALLSIDMNDLKIINDTKGHLAGDKALKKTSYVINRNLGLGCFLYRVGGDEFAVICTKINYKMVEDMITKITVELTKAGIICAIGSAEWKSNMTFEEVYKLADDNMYKNKSAIKKGETR